MAKLNAAAAVAAMRRFDDFVEYEAADLMRHKLAALVAAFDQEERLKQKNTIEITITLRGNPAGVVDALAHGIPLEGLVAIRDGMNDELAMRRERPARGRRRQVRIRASSRAGK